MYEIGSTWYANNKYIEVLDMGAYATIVEYHFKNDLYFELTAQDDNNVFLSNDVLDIRVSVDALEKYFTEVK